MPDGWERIRCDRVGETSFRMVHPTGLTMFVTPKPGYRSAYAVFGTRYGSIDTAFYADGADTPTQVPAGIAHYLEHKLFENEDCGAFERYAKTGASANAYTSFDRTAYLFSCTEKVEESLEILLDFVQSPYFTKETVQKEQGIIGQEIRMGEDNPGRAVLFNLLAALYHRHPVRIDIAGTVESIAQITPELLYGCYHTFYNLRNMALCVAGNITPEQVLRVADRVLKPSAGRRVERAGADEPDAAVTSRVEKTMPVASPLFYLGFKDRFPDGKTPRPARELAAASILTDLLAGPASPLYNRLMERGLINASFDADYFEGPGYGVWMFGGESADPDAAADAIRKEIDRLRREGFSAADFEASRNALYGRRTAAFDEADNCADALLNDFFYDRAPYAAVEAAAEVTEEDVRRLLYACLQERQAALSVVSPLR